MTVHATQDTTTPLCQAKRLVVTRSDLTTQVEHVTCVDCLGAVVAHSLAVAEVATLTLVGLAKAPGEDLALKLMAGAATMAPRAKK